MKAKTKVDLSLTLSQVAVLTELVTAAINDKPPQVKHNAHATRALQEIAKKMLHSFDETVRSLRGAGAS